MINDMKNRGVYRHREFLIWTGAVLLFTGTFAFGVACGRLFGACG